MSASMARVAQRAAARFGAAAAVGVAAVLVLSLCVAAPARANVCRDAGTCCTHFSFETPSSPDPASQAAWGALWDDGHHTRSVAPGARGPWADQGIHVSTREVWPETGQPYPLGLWDARNASYVGGAAEVRAAAGEQFVLSVFRFYPTSLLRHRVTLRWDMVQQPACVASLRLLRSFDWAHRTSVTVYLLRYDALSDSYLEIASETRAWGIHIQTAVEEFHFATLHVDRLEIEFFGEGYGALADVEVCFAPPLAVDACGVCAGSGACASVGEACHTDMAGDCAAGTFDVALRCVPDLARQPELCNGRDDNCNGEIDEGGACLSPSASPSAPPPPPSASPWASWSAPPRNDTPTPTPTTTNSTNSSSSSSSSSTPPSTWPAASALPSASASASASPEPALLRGGGSAARALLLPQLVCVRLVDAAAGEQVYVAVFSHVYVAPTRPDAPIWLPVANATCGGGGGGRGGDDDDNDDDGCAARNLLLVDGEVALRQTQLEHFPFGAHAYAGDAEALLGSRVAFEAYFQWRAEWVLDAGDWLRAPGTAQQRSPQSAVATAADALTRPCQLPATQHPAPALGEAPTAQPQPPPVVPLLEGCVRRLAGGMCEIHFGYFSPHVRPVQASFFDPQAVANASSAAPAPAPARHTWTFYPGRVHGALVVRRACADVRGASPVRWALQTGAADAADAADDDDDERVAEVGPSSEFCE